MVDFPDKTIYLYSEGIDFRCGANTLTNLVSVYFSSSNIYKSLYIFFSRNRRQVKILEVDKNGAWLYQNRMTDARFIFPRCDQSVKIDSHQLKLILKSVELVKNNNEIYI